MLVGFIVVGIIGVFIGQFMIDSAGLAAPTDAYAVWVNNSTGEECQSGDTNYTVGNGTWSNVSATTGDTLYTSQTHVLDTFLLGVTLCKILVVVSVAGIIFMLLQYSGLIPGFGRKQ